MTRPASILALLLAAGLLPGCVCVSPRSICRGWVDWNSYAEWSASVERLEHLPYRRPYVETLRWQYGAQPVRPAPAPVTIAACGGAGGCPADPVDPVDVPPLPTDSNRATDSPELRPPKGPQELLPPPPPPRPQPPLPNPPAGSFPEPTAKANGIQMASGTGTKSLAQRTPRPPQGAWLFTAPR